MSAQDNLSARSTSAPAGGERTGHRPIRAIPDVIHSSIRTTCIFAEQAYYSSWLVKRRTMPETLVDVLGSGDPSAPGLIVGSGGRTYTRGEIHQLAIQFAETLRGSGISAGDVVTIADPNTIEFVVAFLGATYARAVAAPLNQNYTTAEFGFYMDDSQSKILVTGAGGNPAAEAAADLADANIPVLSVRISATDAAAPSIEVRHHTGDFDLRVTAPQAPLSEKPQPGDVALFLHTSGTTSRPKGVPLTHANLVASIENIAATYEFSRADVSLLVMPLFHVHGEYCTFTQKESLHYSCCFVLLYDCTWVFSSSF